MSSTVMATLFTLLTLICLSAPAHSTAPVINPSESPLFQTVDSGRTNFTCIVSGADTIGWIVDDIDANDRRISVIRHIEMYDLETIDDTLRMFRQVISVPNSCMNNRTELVCVAENIVGDDVRSSPVVLIIEGCHTSLSKEKATTEAVDNNTTFHLSGQPLYTYFFRHTITPCMEECFMS